MKRFLCMCIWLWTFKVSARRYCLGGMVQHMVPRERAVKAWQSRLRHGQVCVEVDGQVGWGDSLESAEGDARQRLAFSRENADRIAYARQELYEWAAKNLSREQIAGCFSPDRS